MSNRAKVYAAFLADCPSCKSKLIMEGIPCELSMKTRRLFSSRKKYPIPVEDLLPDKWFTPNTIHPAKCSECGHSFQLYFGTDTGN